MVQRVNPDKATAFTSKPAEKKTELVVKLLRGLRPNEFGLRWIEGSKKVTESSIREAYEILTKEGNITDKKIRTFATLLAKPIEKLRHNYIFLRDEMHLSPEKIATNAQLLGINPDTIRKNGNFLRDEMHLSPERVASRAELLGSNPDTVRKKLETMLRDGIKRQKVENNPVLLGLKRETAIRYAGAKSKTPAV